MSRRSTLSLVSLVSLVLLALLAGWALLSDRKGPMVGEPQPRAEPMPAPRPVAAPEPLDAQPPEPEPQGPRTVHEEALAALVRHSGDGMVRCLLPPDLPEPRLESLSLAAMSDDVLTMAVSTVQGDEVLFARVQTDQGRSLEALVIVQWSGAEPGLVGACSVHELREQALDVYVIDEHDAPGVDARVSVHPSPGETILADEHGHARLTVWQGTTVGVAATQVRDFPALGRGSVTLRIEPTSSSAQVRLEPTDLLSSMGSNRDDILEQEALYNEPIEQALEAEELSQEARALLVSWHEHKTEHTQALEERHAEYEQWAVEAEATQDTEL